MNKIKGIAVAMVALMASGAFAATTATSAKMTSKKVSTIKKTTAKKATAKATAGKTETSAKVDSVNSTSSSAVSAASSSMPGLTAGSSAAEAPKALKKPSALDKIKFALVFEFYGPSVADPFSGYQPALSPDEGDNYANSQGDSAQTVHTNIVLGYRISDNLTFQLNPNFQSTGANAAGDDQGSLFRFREELSYAKLGVGKFLQVGKFKWNGDFRVYPGGLGERTAGRPLYLRTGQNLMYSATPKMTLAAYNTIRYYKRTDTVYGSNPNAYDFRATIGPALEYQVSDSTGLSLSYNMDVRLQKANREFVDGPVDAAPFVEAGAGIDISKMVNLNPYIDVYTNTANIEAWQFGANLALNIL